MLAMSAAQALTGGSSPSMVESLPEPPSLLIHGIDDPDRSNVESFIHNVYRERYGARVQQFAPLLVSLRGNRGLIIAAAGYRTANTGPLFLERYLRQPVERLLSAEAGFPRDRIAEVGHLSATQAGAGKQLIHLLGPHLANLGLDWVVSTLTQELQHLLVRLGITPLALGVADPALLGQDAADWGSYYDHNPIVVAARIDQGLRMLARRQGVQ